MGQRQGTESIVLMTEGSLCQPTLFPMKKALAGTVDDK